MMSPDTAQALIARLDTDRDVNWLMEIIGYGLSMPFSLTGEQDSVKDCCTIYCEWLTSALLPYDENNEDSKYQQLSKLVPVPIRKDPNRYARKMLSHLYNVFLPRQHMAPTYSSSHNSSSGINSKNSHQKDESDAILAAVSRQAVLCHRVLRTIESIAHNQNNLMDFETWQHLLILLLTVNDKLLSPPTEPDDIGTQLHDRILGVLFDLLLIASSRSIPDPSYWKAFDKLCANWRHRPALVDHWRRITLLLTKRITMLPSSSPKNQSDQENQTSANLNERLHNSPLEASISSMNYEILSQSWYRFLNLIGNPVELSDPSVISRTDEFYHAACLANSVLDPRQHPCLNVLPQIFMNSMLGLREFIEAFLLKARRNQSAGSPELPNSKRDVHSLSSDSSNSSRLPSNISPLALNPERPKCNSILHIFGDWLFSAALVGSDLTQEIENLSNSGDSTHQPGLEATYSSDMRESSTSLTSSSATATEGGFMGLTNSPLFSRRQSHQSTTSSHTSISTGRGRRQSKQDLAGSFPQEKITLEPSLSAESFESGQSEAMALLCMIFSAKSHTEDILPAYLARFYLCLQHCLNFGIGYDPKSPDTPTGPIKRQLLSSVLTYSTTLLQRDLDGINLLIPSFIKAIEVVLECNEQDVPIQPPPRQHTARSGSVRNTAGSTNQNLVNFGLRRASIISLVNLLAYPLHFQDLAIRNCLDGKSPTTTFGSLRPRLLKLLFVALQTEKDVKNMQILFSGLSLALHDLASDSPRSLSDNKRHNNSSKRNESGHNSLDGSGTASNVGQSADTISQSSFVFNSNDGFLIKSLHVTCHLLINIWKHDNLVSLAALEVLTTIARVSTYVGSSNTRTADSYNNNNIEMKSEYMQTTKWICDYICNQCSRPPPAHSRDMHSTIVAAYQCLSVWFYNHPYLLKEKHCVNTLIEVVELGVSGQKSKSLTVNPMGITSHTIIGKGEKQLKPSSMRVREAAESLLNICMVRTSHDGQRDISSCDTVLNELDIAEVFGGIQMKNSANSRSLTSQSNESRHLEAYKLFKYFSDEESIIFALFECQTSQHHQPQLEDSCRDSVICLMRTPFGKHCWRMKFNYMESKSKEKLSQQNNSSKAIGLIKRPFQQQAASSPITESRIFSLPKGPNKSLYFNNSARFFPESIENISPSELDCLVTTLDQYVNNPPLSSSSQTNPRLKGDLDKMGKIFAHQVLAEQKVMSECSIRIKRTDCEKPQPVGDLETARIIVTHLGLDNALASLVDGERVSAKFVDNLRDLDSQSIRTCDSVNIFYVRRNRTSLMEILESVRERHNVSLEFFEWLLELGRPVVVREHNRWTGRRRDLPATTANGQSSSYGLYHHQHGLHVHHDNESSAANSLLTRNKMLTSDHGGAIFDGDRMTLYWADMCQELAFLVPHRLEKLSSNIVIFWLENADDLPNVPTGELLAPSSNQPDSNSSVVGGIQRSDEEPAAPNRANLVAGDYQTPIVPANKANQPKQPNKDYTIYFISPMKNGLFRINLSMCGGKQHSCAMPLIDGMTISKGMLAGMMRESILNLSRRRRLDADSYQPPHVRRRLKIQEICNNYKISARHESSEFYFNLFRSKSSN